MEKGCKYGRINPSPETKLRLFSDSAGYCSRPECDRYLFSIDGEIEYNIGEMAHIIAASTTGPRPNAKLDPSIKADYNNLILLCPNCHTEVDKAPELFPVSLLLEWKANHTGRITLLMGIPQVSNRREACKFVRKLQRQNWTVYNSLNPNLPYHEIPDAEEANVWKRKVVSQIIPNSQKILLFLDQNSNLLFDNELIIVEEFRQHLDDLIDRHLGSKSNIGSQYPIEMNNILND
ncbi:hypothetical protein BV902_17380 [Sphingobacterium sp. B29]|uniref:HNH endonuclease n=1 Tax=Sphingobacterium sp. B29 TaxID=1933220 RepID=UPI0009584B48|nr:HNH endonuclease [Sphingobacterium sp. B29]APU97884.1 hypothetical protein BV902_17380 [Sphingobacterium sp. B29]